MGIRQMSDALANRIAAGEVVEQPCQRAQRVGREQPRRRCDEGDGHLVGRCMQELVVEDDGVVWMRRARCLL